MKTENMELDFENLNYYFNNPIYPFEQQLQQPQFQDLPCFDSSSSTLFDIDHLNHNHNHNHNYNHNYDLITPSNYIPQYPYLDFPTEDYYTQFLPFPCFNGFTPEFGVVSDCGVFNGDFEKINQISMVGNNHNYHHNHNPNDGSNNKVRVVSAQSRAARERRRKITEKTQELGKLVPGGTKMNTAEMFQAAFKYVKFLQAQVEILQSMKTLQQDCEKEINLCNLPILASQSIQEKLYTKEKCLVPSDFAHIFEEDCYFETNELIH